MYATPSLQPVQDDEQYVALDGTQYPANWDKSTIPELTPVNLVAPPTNPALKVIGYHIDAGFNQVWETTAKSQPELDAELIDSALQALLVTDAVAVRCLKAGVPFTPTWETYTTDLRAIAAGGPGPLPGRPDYPAGS